ncbi:MAG: repeat, subgroup [Thermomicrobiales bacterium]|nr:repeat, subgroup [Thermomicrobiales bacterium]
MMSTPDARGRDDVEVAHEALIRHWPRLRGWLDDDRSALLLREAVRDAAREWEQHNRDESYVAHRGRRLDQAESLRHLPRIGLNALELAYLDAAVALREREQREREAQRQRELAAERERAELAEAARGEAEQRVAEQAIAARRLQRRLLVAVGLGALALLAALGAFAFYQQAEGERILAQRQTTIARVRQLTAQSLALADDQLDLALLLGLEANRINDTAETRGAIATGLGSSPHLARYLRSDPNAGRSVAFNSDGSRLAVAKKGGVEVWDLAKSERSGPSLSGHVGPVTSVAFSPTDADLVATAGAAGTVRLWDVAAGQADGEALVGHSGEVASIAFSPDGATLLSGGEDGASVLWDLTTRQPIGEPLVAESSVTSVAFAPNGDTFAVGGDLDTIVVWDAASRQQARVLAAGVGTAVWSLAYSPTDANLLVSGGSDGAIRLWDVSTGEAQGEPLAGHTGVVSSLSFSSDGGTLASGDFDGTVRLWNVATGQSVAEPLTGHGQLVSGVAFRPGGGDPALASSSEDGRIILWDVGVGNRLGSVVDRQGPHNALMDLAFALDDNVVAITPADGITLWDIGQGKTIRNFGVALLNPSLSLAINPTDRRTLVVGSADGAIRFWDAATGAALSDPLTAHTEWVLALAFSPDGKLVASASEDGTVRLWDVTARAARGSPISGYADEVQGVAFSPVDANLLAFCGTDGTLVLWDVAVGQPRAAPLVGHEGRVQSVAFSPDGKLLASAGSDGTVRLWDAVTGSARGALPIEQASNILAVAFSPDGALLAAGDAGGSIHLWDAGTWQPLGLPLTGHSGFVLSLAFGPHGRILMSGDLTGEIIVWDVDFASWRARACDLADRNLTAEEWARYLGEEPYRETCSRSTHRDAPAYSRVAAEPSTPTAVEERSSATPGAVAAPVATAPVTIRSQEP